MHIVAVVARVLMGLLFLMSSITYLSGLIEPPPLEGAMKTFSDGLDAAAYLMPTVKIVELICGIAFVSGRFVPLATVLVAPIIVNIVCVGVFLAPEGLPFGAFLVLANVIVACRHRAAYGPLLKA